jgi:phage repressor protein C with HTH and peptisase S24 domain
MEITNPIIAEIDRRARLQGFTLTSLAKAADLANTTLTKMAKDPTGAPSIPTLKKVARVLNCSHKDFDTSVASRNEGGAMRGDVRPARVRLPSHAQMAKDLPVKGTVAGAVVNNGFEITDRVVEYVSRPPALEGSPDAYALRVVGESMVPLHRPGDLCIVHPYRPHKRGDSVIIQIETYDGSAREGYIKIFKRETDDKVICEQYNPPAEISYNKKTIVSIHKVLTVAELFGA